MIYYRLLRIFYCSAEVSERESMENPVTSYVKRVVHLVLNCFLLMRNKIQRFMTQF